MRRTCWPHPSPPRAPGVSHEAIAAAVRTFRAVEHRLEFVRNVSGIDFYNDSKATSVDATLKALDAFPGGLWVILGGKDKGLDYAPLRAPLAAKGARRAADRRGRGEDRRPTGWRGSAGGRAHARCGHRPRIRARRGGRHRAAGAGLRQLRSIPQLRASRRDLQTSGERIETEELTWRNGSKPTGFSSPP